MLCLITCVIIYNFQPILLVSHQTKVSLHIFFPADDSSLS